MKNHIIKSGICAVLLPLILLCSCAKTVTCTVKGQPHSKLYDSDGTYMGEIPASGNLQISFNTERDIPLLLYTQATPDSPRIPMGLDYTKYGRVGIKIFRWLFLIPTFSLSFALPDRHDQRYFDRKYNLRPNKYQQDNSDLNDLVNRASNPIDEIKSQQQKNENPVIRQIPWLNKSGEFTEIISIGLKKTTVPKHIDPIKFKSGNVSFNFADDPVCKIKGVMDNGREYNLSITLKSKFKKRDNSYYAKDTDDHDIVLSRANDGIIEMTFKAPNSSDWDCTLTFKEKSFKETTVSNQEDALDLIFGTGKN